ncbi:MAG: CHAT domain-containing protein [Xenococcaceae cyanobacterium]
MKINKIKLSILWLLTSIALYLANLPPSIAQNSSEADNLYRAGINSLATERLLVAKGELERALQLYQNLNDKEGQFNTAIALGEVYYRQGEFQQARQILERIESISGNFPQQGRLWTTKGLVYLETGAYRQAIVALQRAEMNRGTDLALHNRIRIGLGEAYRYLGLYPQSLSYLELASRNVGDRHDYGRSLNALGEVHFDLGEYDKALDYYQQALNVRQSLGDRYGAIRTLNNLGQIYRQMGKSVEAIEFYQQALRDSDALGDATNKVYILNNLGETYAELGKQTEAIDSFGEALSISRNNITVAYVQTLNNLGKYYRRFAEYEKSLENYQQAIAWAQKLGDRPSQGKALIGMGETYLQSKQLERAIGNLEAGVDIFESLRPGLLDEQKVSLFDFQTYAYQLLQKALIEAGKYQPALIVAEKGRARAFAELLVKRISESNYSEKNDKPLTISQIQAVAKNSKATLVEYSVLQDEKGQESELLVWIVKPTGEILFRRIDLKSQTTESKTSVDSLENALLQATRSQQTTSLSNLVWSVRENMLDRSIGQSDRVVASSQKAYELIIQPIADLLPKDPQERVIFIPQRSLFLAPFQALQDASGKYLIEKHTVAIAPSIQILALTQKQQSTINFQQALVVGNPAPMPENLSPLPGAEAEAKDVAQLLQTQALTKERATKQAVLSKISGASIVHLATHGLFNERQGLQSFLALAQSDRQDGLLTAEEVLNLPLKANLAVLSACSTGRGQITGDGVIGLSRSFMSAGVPSVIVSLWNIPDLPTASLMTKFYRNWQQSRDKSQALRQAMLEVMKENPDPYNWAGFVLMGQSE